MSAATSRRGRRTNGDAGEPRAPDAASAMRATRLRGEAEANADIDADAARTDRASASCGGTIARDTHDAHAVHDTPVAAPPTLAALARRVAMLEAERAIRATMTRYMSLCDVPADAADRASLAALFTADAIWEGVGPQYAHQFGRLRGPGEIVAMLLRYLPPTPHFATNVHFLTSETIVVDGAAGRGCWIMLQASDYVDAPAELIAARLTVDFAPSAAGDAWLIRHFRTERLFDAPWRVNRRSPA
ncbi:snoaL-like domain protein [Burkholderia oklahomensis]|uniref:SnoaL-like domain protein n=2 Tax=Burkholderia oklahomensis TaxID=342113 RepID=A0AAI8BEM8_9BURK|nr:snoaL-like domain protein [Burkholderia oklahomensis]